MKKYFILIIAVLELQNLSAQIYGETDMISRPIDHYAQNKIHDLKSRPPIPTCTDLQNYACGYNWGFYEGYEAGLYDAISCHKYQTFAGQGWPQPPYGDAYINGYYDAWYPGYEEGYADRIAEKAADCPADYAFDEFYCECRCTEYQWELDADDDNYYSQNTAPRYQCFSPGTGWKKSTELFGIDCNDSDRHVWRYNDCGKCSSEPGLTVWYFDEDKDGYHRATMNACNKPGANYSLSTNGFDCDDEDKDANISKRWYYFGDADNYYGTDRISCERPSEGIASRWKTTPGSGEDCDDTNPDIIGEATRYYDYDGDGYYGAEQTSCHVNEEWEDGRWSTDPGSGPDCDDKNEDKQVNDVCGICGGDGTPITIYWDTDGDGYYGFEFTEFCNDYDIHTKVLVMSLDFWESLGMPSSAWDFPADIVNDATISLPTWVPGVGMEIQDHPYQYNSITNRIPIKPPYDQYFSTAKHKVTIQFWSQENPESLLFVAAGLIPDLYGTDLNLGKDCNDLDPNQWSYGQWYADRDRDGYHDPNVAPTVATCTPPDDGYVLLNNSLGEDCDDTDKWANGERIWYYSDDGDEYYGSTAVSCENPAKGTADESKWQTDPGEGQDCDDTDSNATVEKNWYKDQDGDGYYSQIIFQCSNPGKDTPEEDHWKTDAPNGQDCYDLNAEINTYNQCGVCGGTDDPVPYYIDLDGDGYHSVVKEEDCGLSVFPESLIQNSDFPADLIQEPSEETYQVSITGTAYVFTYDNGTYEFPPEVLSYETLGLDCDDLDPSTKADGLWYADADGDGYHSPSVEPTVGCTPPSENYILLRNSLGLDCDDTESIYNVEYKWYKDLDGDGYFVDYVVDCRSPGFGWNLTSSAGADDDDTNPFTPHYSDADFVLPSLFETEVVDNVTYVRYMGQEYRLDQFSIMYRGAELQFEDLIFDRVAPENRLLANTLLSGREAAIYDVEIVTTIDGVSAAEQLGDPSDPELSTQKTEWIQGKVNNGPVGYSMTWGSASFGDITDPSSFNEDAAHYFDELFDPAKFAAFKNHYETYGGSAFTLAVETYEADFSEDGEAEVLKEKFGGKDLADVVIMAKKFFDGHVEFVVFIRDDEFKASQEDLIENTTWLNPDGTWKNPDEEDVYKNQLGLIQQYRNHQLPILALDYQNDASAPPSPEVPDLPSEIYPEYNFGGGLGILTKWYEFLDIGHFVGRNFKMPRGTWDEDFITGEEDFDQSPDEVKDRESAERWRTKSPSSVAGFADGSLQEVRDFVDMLKLAQSLVYRETWEQILESVKNFNPGEMISGMFDMFDEKVGELQGDDGIYVQYHSIGEITARSIAAIVNGWNSIGRIGKKLFNVKQAESPVNKLKRKYQDFGENFADKINTSPRFKNLEPDVKQKLIDDLSNSPEELGEALARNNGELIDSWKKMDDLRADEALRRNPGALDALNRPWKQRPEPNTYLSPGHLSSHRAVFQDDIVRVTSQSKIDEFGTLGSNDAFVMTRKEFDVMVLETGRDLRKIEEKLGFEPNSLSNDVVFAGIKRRDLGEIKMPSGNESGTSLTKWIPGGKTSGGISEGIVDLSSVVPYDPL